MNINVWVVAADNLAMNPDLRDVLGGAIDLLTEVQDRALNGLDQSRKARSEKLL